MPLNTQLFHFDSITQYFVRIVVACGNDTDMPRRKTIWQIMWKSPFNRRKLGNMFICLSLFPCLWHVLLKNNHVFYFLKKENKIILLKYHKHISAIKYKSLPFWEIVIENNNQHLKHISLIRNDSISTTLSINPTNCLL